MVKAPANSLSPDNSKNYHHKVLTDNKNALSGDSLNGSGAHHHSQFHYLNKNNNNNHKKSNRRIKMAEPPGSVGNVNNQTPTLLVTAVTPISVTASPQSGTPMIAVVAPTARTTNTSNNNNNNNNNSHLKGNHSPIKATTSANLVHQQQQQQQQQRLHQIPHIYHALPVQIPLLNAPSQTAWPTTVVEPAFHFGPGFERAPSMEIQNPRHCPTHGTQNNQTANTGGNSQEHVVFFHVSPGVSVTFQIGNNREVVRGK